MICKFIFLSASRFKLVAVKREFPQKEVAIDFSRKLLKKILHKTRCGLFV